MYRLATVGNVKGSRPPMWDMLGRAKWYDPLFNSLNFPASLASSNSFMCAVRLSRVLGKEMFPPVDLVLFPVRSMSAFIGLG